MKIKKLDENLKPLTEAEDVSDDIEQTSDSEVEATVKVTSAGKDAKPATAHDALVIENALTRVLDQAFDDANYALEEENFDSNCNILVTGLPGSSKTATIKNWCKKNGCNLYYLDAKNPDLQLLTSGAASIDKTDPKKPAVENAYSNALSKLDRPNSVLFLDELNRQVKEYMRGSLLTLVADRRVAGDDEEGFRYFPNLLFTVAAVNPAAESDRGASELNPAEDRRFYYNVIFNSEVASTKSYFAAYYDSKVVEYAKKHSAFNKEDIDRINSLILRQWLGNKIISNSAFKYTTMDQYLAKTDKGKIMCQSVLTELIDHSRGSLERLKNDINASNLLKEAKDMLIKIIDGIVLPNPDALRAKKAADLGVDLGPTDIKSKEPSKDDSKDEDEIKDDDFEKEDDKNFGDSGDGDAIDKSAGSAAETFRDYADRWQSGR